MSPTDLIGKQIEGVIASWYLTDGVDVHDLMHVWLRIAGLGDVRCHILNGLVLDLEPPPEPYAMPELGAHVDVEENTPGPLAAIVGGSITGITPVRFARKAGTIGFAMHTSLGTVCIADVGDDLAIGDWDDRQRWSQAGIIAGQ